MAMRFRKSVKIAPGIKLNAGKKSTGISIGNKGGGLTFNTKTGITGRVSAPGTGFSYTSKVGGKKRKKDDYNDSDAAYYIDDEDEAEAIAVAEGYQSVGRVSAATFRAIDLAEKKKAAQGGEPEPAPLPEEKPKKKMSKGLKILWGIIIALWGLLFLTMCSGDDAEEPAAPPEAEQGQVSETTLPAAEPVEDPEIDFSKLLEAFAVVYPEGNVSAQKVGDHAEVVIATEFSATNRPQGWDEIVQRTNEMLAAHTIYEDLPVTAQLEDKNGTILLSGYNGAVHYNWHEKRAEIEQNATEPAREESYAASTESDKFHKLGCRHAKNIQDGNKVLYSSRSDAIAAGKSPCGVCKP